MIRPRQFGDSREAHRACLAAARREPNFEALIWLQVAWEEPEDDDDHGGWYFDHEKPEAWVTSVYETPPDGGRWVVYGHVKPVIEHKMVFPFTSATQAAIAAGLPPRPKES